MNLDPLYIIIVFVITLISVILHELAHGLVAYWLGDHTTKDAGRLTFNPLKHIDPYMSLLVPVILYIARMPVFGGAKPVPINPYNLKGKAWGMALVALAGPLTNFLLALVSFLIGYFSGALSAVDTLAYFVFKELIFINLGFMFFNLIPIPPLDGSRVLYAAAPDAVRDFLQRIERYGFIIVYALIFLLGDVFSVLMINGRNGILDFFYALVGH